LPPRVFLDTQIIADIERGHITEDGWALASTYLAHETRYSISPLTVAELLRALANSSSEYFGKHQRRLQLLISPDSHSVVFDLPLYFIAERLKLRFDKSDRLENDLLGVIKLILSAPSKQALLTGFSSCGATCIKVNLDQFMKEDTQNIDGYVRLMNARKEVMIPRKASRNPDYI
jgi:predicted nucleic acid-binding protein